MDYVHKFLHPSDFDKGKFDEFVALFNEEKYSAEPMTLAKIFEDVQAETGPVENVTQVPNEENVVDMATFITNEAMLGPELVTILAHPYLMKGKTFIHVGVKANPRHRCVSAITNQEDGNTDWCPETSKLAVAQEARNSIHGVDSIYYAIISMFTKNDRLRQLADEISLHLSHGIRLVYKGQPIPKKAYSAAVAMAALTFNSASTFRFVPLMGMHPTTGDPERQFRCCLSSCFENKQAPVQLRFLFANYISAHLKSEPVRSINDATIDEAFTWSYAMTRTLATEASFLRNSFISQISWLLGVTVNSTPTGIMREDAIGQLVSPRLIEVSSEFKDATVWSIPATEDNPLYNPAAGPN